MFWHVWHVVNNESTCFNTFFVLLTIVIRVLSMIYRHFCNIWVFLNLQFKTLKIGLLSRTILDTIEGRFNNMDVRFGQKLGQIRAKLAIFWFLTIILKNISAQNEKYPVEVVNTYCQNNLRYNWGLLKEHGCQIWPKLGQIPVRVE